jgi:hypothetical protein
MPVTKRYLFPASSFQANERLFEADVQPDVQVFATSNLLGSIRQLAFLSSYALEIFQNLAVLAEEVQERTKDLSQKTELTIKKLAEFDRGVRNCAVQPDLKLNRLSRKYLKFRELTTPPIFVKTTNYSSILIQYKACRNSPQLWRLENIIGEDCFRYYSFPGYFFEEWLKTEIIKQELSREQRKKDKAMRKQLKKERKRLKESGEAVFSKRFSNSGRPKSLLTKENILNDIPETKTGAVRVTSSEVE